MAWVGFDFDGTLVKGHSGKGDVVVPMLNRLKEYLAQGVEVRILTARAGDLEGQRLVKMWLSKQGLPDLKVTDKKDYGMIVFYDDRARQVIPDTGIVVGEEVEEHEEGTIIIPR